MCLAAVPYGLISKRNFCYSFLAFSMISFALRQFLCAYPLVRDGVGTTRCGQLNRARILAQLDATPGEQLVIVRYEPRHDTDWEWVYSEGDNRPVKSRLWARDMGTAQNEELIEYFKGRRVRVVDTDEDTPQLVPYEERPESVGRN